MCRTHPLFVCNTKCQEESQLQHTSQVSRTSKSLYYLKYYDDMSEMSPLVLHRLINLLYLPVMVRVIIEIWSIGET
jgi:hypothetical protein